MAKEFKIKMGFDINKQELQRIVNDIERVIDNLNKKKINLGANTENIDAQIKKLNQIKDIFGKFNKISSGHDARKFTEELGKIGHSITGLNFIFNKSGIEVGNFFNKLNEHLNNTRLEVKETETIVDKFGKTLLNALKWNLASVAIHRVERFIREGYHYIKELDSSLNNIRVVTGASTKEMELFAKQASIAARELGRTTKEYVDASLIYFQQGKTKKEVEELVKATLISANITGQTVEETSELMTAALNGYNMSANKAMEVADKFAAVGASTGASFKEIAIGFSKVASMGKVAGVTFDQLNAMIATISTITRESPESIGTSLKAIFGRMTELKVGKKDEDGWTTGRIEAALNKVGLSLIDEKTGELKELGKVIDEIGQKWKTLNRESQLAISTALAGSRQQNRFIALLDNYDMYQDALFTSLNAMGTANKQNEIRLDSINAKLAQTKNNLEAIWESIYNSDAIKHFIDLLNQALNILKDLTNNLGTLGGSLLVVGLGTEIFKNKATTGLLNSTEYIKSLIEGRKQWNNIIQEEAEIKKQRMTLGDKADENIEFLRKENINKSHKTQYLLKKYINEDAAIKASEYYDIMNDLLTQKERVLKEKPILKTNLLREYQESNQVVLKEIESLDQEFKEIADIINGKFSKYKSKNVREGLMQMITEFDKAVEQEPNKDSKKFFPGTAAYEAYVQAGFQTGGKKDPQFVQPRISTINQIKEELQQYEQLQQRLQELVNTRKQYKDMVVDISKVEQEAEKIIQEKVAAIEQEIAANQEAVDSLTQYAQRMQKMEKIVTWGAFALTTLPLLINGFKQISEAQDTLADKSAAWGDSITQIGSAFLMLPGHFKLIAISIMGIGQAIKYIGQVLDEVYQAQKRNKEIIEQTEAIISKADEKIANLHKAKSAVAELNTLMANGGRKIADLSAEELDKYHQLSSLIAEIAPELVSFYDEQGRAIINLNANIDDLIQKQRELKKEAYVTRANNARSFVLEYSSNNALYQNEIDKLEQRINEGKYSEGELTELQNKLLEYRQKLDENRKNFQENVLNSFFMGNTGINNIMASGSAIKFDYLNQLQSLLNNNAVFRMFNNNDQSNLTGYLATLNKFYDAASNFNEALQKKILNLDKGELLAIVRVFDQFNVSVNDMARAMEKFVSMDESQFTKMISSVEDFYNTLNGNILNVDTQQLTTTVDNQKKQMEEKAQLLGQYKDELARLDQKIKDDKDGIVYDEIYNRYNELQQIIPKIQQEINDLSVAYAKNNEILNQSIVVYQDFIRNLLQTHEGTIKVYNAFNQNLDKIKELDDAITKAGNNQALRQNLEEQKNAIIRSNQQMYDVIMENDENYYKEWVRANADRIAVEQATYGVIAANYKTKAEYIAAIEQAKNQGILLDTRNSINLITKYQRELTNFMSGQAQERVRLTHIANQEVVKSYWEQAQKIAEIEYKKTHFLGGLRWALFVSAEEKEKLTLEQYNKLYKEETPYNMPTFDPNMSKLPVPKLPSLPKSGAKITGSGSGSGSSGSGASRGEDLKKDLDILHDTNVVLKQQEEIIDRLQRKEKELYGDALYKNLLDQNKALKEKKMILEAQIKLIDQEVAKMRQQLAAKGVKFNKDGTIANYNAFQQSLMNQVNSIKNADKFKAAKEKAEEIFKLMEKYENYYLNIKIDKKKAIDEINSVLAELSTKEIKLKLDVELDLINEKLENLDFILSVNDKFENLSENISDVVKKMQLLNKEKDKLDKQFNEVKDNKNLNEKERIALLDELENKLMNVGKELKSSYDTYLNLIKKTVQEIDKLINEQVGLFNNLINDIDYLDKVKNLMGQGKDYDFSIRAAEIKTNIYQNEIKVIKESVEKLEKLQEAFKEGSEEWKEINKEIENLNNQLENITLKILENLKNGFKAEFDKLTVNLEKQLFNGKTYKQFKEEYDELIAQQRKYLSNEEKIIAIGELQQQIEQQLNETYSERNKEILQDFYDTQLKALQQKDKLTRYDVERAEKLYNITLKQIALEEARNNKTLMKLVRDTQGNWSYQYVEDAKKIQSVQEALSKDLRELMEFDKKQLEQIQQEMLQAKYQFMQDIQQIIQDGLNGQYATQEEFYAAIEQAQTNFKNKIVNLEFERFNISYNVSESTLATILNTYKKTTNNLNILVLEQEQILKTMASQVGDKWSKISALSRALMTQDEEYFRNNFANVIPIDVDIMKTKLQDLFSAISQDWSAQTLLMYNTTQQDFTKMSTEVENFEKNVDTYISNVKTSWEGYQTKLGEVKKYIDEQFKLSIDNNNQSLDTMKQILENINSNNDELASGIEIVSSKIQTELTEIQSLLETFGDISEIYENYKTNLENIINVVDVLITKYKELAAAKMLANEIKEQAPQNKVPNTISPPTSSRSGSRSKNDSGDNSGRDNGGISSKGVGYNNMGLSEKEAIAVQKLINYIHDPDIQVDGKLGPETWSVLKSQSFKNNIARIRRMIDWQEIEETYGNKALNFVLGVVYGSIEPPKFDTGGYTGEWLDNKGRLAILHQKELVLNKYDTQNILKTVQIVRDFSNLLNISKQQLAFNGAMSGTTIQQNINIYADFPNVTSSDEIKKAFMDLENRAAQYIRNFKK